ncbi:MAG TPA: threonine--tRNA ligase [Candidatus Magasanikbacteria bacterium]|jgi:threonyl-tRNA synthetase|nr:threonine--tRNA ligase [Candidatus Magasanikbacteria bacterium]HQF57237.1 threonine--tRNA ligase [Candidatus Magasanikbacteria bacterium]HQL52634.1 threonine--tRNA ligase [Candidatus Magasanikbacteria bacterium]
MNKEQRKSLDEAQMKLEIMRHSCAHLVAAAIQALYPEAKFGVGPVVENGFYYDVEFPETINEEALQEIEKKAKHLVKQNLKFERIEMSIDEAIKFFSDKNQTYKVLLLNDLKERGTTKMSTEELQHFGESVKNVSLYKTGEFVDLCRGPHIETSKEIGAFKLTKLAGAYWRGDEKNSQLQRIYGVCFTSEEELNNYLKMLEEIEKRDHRKLGRDLDIYSFDDEVGSGLPLWHPNGVILIEEIEKLAKEKEYEFGYCRVQTPHIAKQELYLRSGHLPYYKDSMFPPMEMDKEIYYLKAMNCPHHHKIFSSKKRSYRELPIRYAEYGHCYRYEDSGALFGLMRVRSLSMNDAHIYCTEEQFEEEFIKVLDLYKFYFELFGITKYQMRLSKHAEEGLGKKYVDNERLWLKTEEQVRNALIKSGLPFVEVENEAAFYGPKIDVEIWSVIGREFTLATNQLDFAVPERFNLTYIDKDGTEKTPICIHRAPLSTHERLIGFLLEHYAGAFPIWLSPVQVQFVPVSEKHVSGTRELENEFKNLKIRTVVDDADETVGKKVKKAVTQKIPYIVVVGDNELNGEDWTIRVRGQEEQLKMSKNDFLEKITKEIAERI